MSFPRLRGPRDNHIKRMPKSRIHFATTTRLDEMTCNETKHSIYIHMNKTTYTKKQNDVHDKQNDIHDKQNDMHDKQNDIHYKQNDIHNAKKKQSRNKFMAKRES
jgi:hypothetical protein